MMPYVLILEFVSLLLSEFQNHVSTCHFTISTWYLLGILGLASLKILIFLSKPISPPFCVSKRQLRLSFCLGQKFWNSLFLFFVHTPYLSGNPIHINLKIDFAFRYSMLHCLLSGLSCIITCLDYCDSLLALLLPLPHQTYSLFSGVEQSDPFFKQILIITLLCWKPFNGFIFDSVKTQKSLY